MTLKNQPVIVARLIRGSGLEGSSPHLAATPQDGLHIGQRDRALPESRAHLVPQRGALECILDDAIGLALRWAFTSETLLSKPSADHLTAVKGARSS